MRLAWVDMQMLEEVKMKTLFLFKKILNYTIGPPISKNYWTWNGVYIVSTWSNHLIVMRVFFLCPFWATSLATYHPSIGVQLRRMITKYSTHTLMSCQESTTCTSKYCSHKYRSTKTNSTLTYACWILFHFGAGFAVGLKQHVVTRGTL